MLFRSFFFVFFIKVYKEVRDFFPLKFFTPAKQLHDVNVFSCYLKSTCRFKYIKMAQIDISKKKLNVFSNNL